MTKPVPRDVLLKVRKLALLPEEVKQSQWPISITRLTTLKSLCREPSVAHRFVTYLARKTLERVEQGEGRSGHDGSARDLAHRQLMADALDEMEAWLQEPSEQRRKRLLDLEGRMRQEQNDHQRINWGAVRLIHDWDLLLFENAITCLLRRAPEAPLWAYQTARDYAERDSSGKGSGLVAASVPLVEDIAAFWIHEYDLDPAALTAPAREKKAKKGRPAPAGPGKRTPGKRKKARFTARQGQFLAFIHLYLKLHRQGPVELDMVKYFRVTPPSVHGMVVKLEELGLITRLPGVPRSARVAIPEAEIPALEPVQGAPW